MQKISPFLWFESEAEDAANHYVSIFRNSRIVKVARYGDAGPGPKGSVMTVGFELEGQTFTALNGGPMFKFNESISFVVDCTTQTEVDHYWDRLLEGGTAQQCGWLKDRYGLSWQIVPRVLVELLTGADPATAGRVMQAMFGMVKLDIAKLQQAAKG